MQLRNAKEGGRDEAERAAYRGAICGHVVRAARLAVEAMQINGADFAEQYNRVRVLGPLWLEAWNVNVYGMSQENMENVLAYNMDMVANLTYLPAEFTTAVHQLWADAAFKREVYEYAGDSVLMDSAA